MACYMTFSILYRIELAVTELRGQRGTSGATFQYPLSDRTRCNISTGASSMSFITTFSILYRIELAVTV